MLMVSLSEYNQMNDNVCSEMCRILPSSSNASNSCQHSSPNCHDIIHNTKSSPPNNLYGTPIDWVANSSATQSLNPSPAFSKSMKSMQIHPQNCLFPYDDHHPSNTPIHRPTPLTTRNSIQIHSAVLPQYTFRTHRQT